MLKKNTFYWHKIGKVWDIGIVEKNGYLMSCRQLERKAHHINRDRELFIKVLPIDSWIMQLILKYNRFKLHINKTIKLIKRIK